MCFSCFLSINKYLDKEFEDIAPVSLSTGVDIKHLVIMCGVQYALALRMKSIQITFFPFRISVGM